MWTECGQKVSRVFATSFKSFRYNIGAIAQLGERLRGTQEVGGSIPPSSTNLFLGIRLLLISLFDLISHCRFVIGRY